MSRDGKPEPEESVCRVGMKMPPFWPKEPALWFAQVEGQFFISGITSDITKFYYVIAQLEHQYAAEVKDIIVNPPADNKYQKLKLELIKRLSESQDARIKQLVTREELGDRKPSQYLRCLEELADGAVSESFLRSIWASRLPTNIQTVIATQMNTTLKDVAELADRVYDIAPPVPVVASVQPSTSTGSTIDDIARRMEELTCEVASLRSQVRARSLSRDRGRRDRSKSRHRPHSSNGQCWYHTRFRDRAFQCIPPCTFKTTSSSAGNASGSRK